MDVCVAVVCAVLCPYCPSSACGLLVPSLHLGMTCTPPGAQPSFQWSKDGRSASHKVCLGAAALCKSLSWVRRRAETEHPGKHLMI